MFVLCKVGAVLMNNPMKDRRAALDLAIIALDTYRREKLIWMTNKQNKQELIDKVNRAIKILIEMKEQGPLI